MTTTNKKFWYVRAETPRAIAGRFVTAEGEIVRILRGFDPPFAATLVPLHAQDNGRLFIDKEGLLKLPLMYWRANLRGVTAPAADGLFDLPALPWPGPVERALLMVFFIGPKDQGGLVLGGSVDTKVDFESSVLTDGATGASDSIDVLDRIVALVADGSAPTPEQLIAALKLYAEAQTDGIAPDHVAVLYPSPPRDASAPGGTQGPPQSATRTKPGSAGQQGSAEGFRFALASCQYPGGLIDRSLGIDVPGPYSVGVSDRSWFRLAQLPAEETPGLLIVAGDQVYVDATAGMFDPKTLDDGMRGAYRSLRANRGYTAMFNRAIERVAMIDDHEIEDNFEPLPRVKMEDSCPPGSTLFQGACSYIDEIRRQENLGCLKGAYKLSPQTCFAFAFERGGHRFMMADTRTEREGRSATNVHAARIMGAAQFRELLKFIDDADPAPAFVTTPSILLPRLLAVARQPSAALLSDSWDGYPASLHALLAHLYMQGRGNIVFLSGDAHISCAARITLWNDQPGNADDGTKRVVVHSIHGSALYAPFPFANAIEEDYACAETFAFDTGGSSGAPPTLACRVETYFPRAHGRAVGDGFVLLATRRAGDRWAIDLTFDGEHGRDGCVLDVG